MMIYQTFFRFSEKFPCGPPFGDDPYEISRNIKPLHRERFPSSTALRFGNRIEKEPYHRKRSPRETSPPLRGTSSTALRFGNHLALPCGQHLMGQKGPIRGGFEGFLALEFA